MKLNAKVLALASAVSVVFWYLVSTVSLLVVPMGVVRFFLMKMPMNMASLMVINTVVIFVSAFLVVFTTAYLYNRFER